MVTDLTNTTWLLKAPSFYTDVDISFKVNINCTIGYHNYVSTQNYFSYKLVRDQIIIGYDVYDDNTNFPLLFIINSVNQHELVYSTGSESIYLGYVAPFITFTGGDTTNTELIAWLYENATLLPITTLANATWGFKNSEIVSYGNGDVTQINLNGTIDDVNWIGFLSPYGEGGARYCTIAIGFGEYNYLYISQTDYLYSSVTDGEGWYLNSGSSFTKLITPPTLAITGGADATNTSVIFWFSEIIATYSPATVYTITTTGTNVTFSGDTEITEGETATVTISAATGYAMPIEITVTGATSEYDFLTGAITLSEPTGAVTITASALTQEEYFNAVANGLVDTINEKANTSGQKGLDEAWVTAQGIETIPTITITLSQVISQDPLTVQLTNEQIEILDALEPFGALVIDATDLGYTEPFANAVDDTGMVFYSKNPPGGINQFCYDIDNHTLTYEVIGIATVTVNQDNTIDLTIT